MANESPSLFSPPISEPRCDFYCTIQSDDQQALAGKTHPKALTTVIEHLNKRNILPKRLNTYTQNDKSRETFINKLAEHGPEISEEYIKNRLNPAAVKQVQTELEIHLTHLCRCLHTYIETNKEDKGEDHVSAPPRDLTKTLRGKLEKIFQGINTALLQKQAELLKELTPIELEEGVDLTEEQQKKLRENTKEFNQALYTHFWKNERLKDSWYKEVYAMCMQEHFKSAPSQESQRFLNKLNQHSLKEQFKRTVAEPMTTVRLYTDTLYTHTTTAITSAVDTSHNKRQGSQNKSDIHDAGVLLASASTKDDSQDTRQYIRLPSLQYLEKENLKNNFSRHIETYFSDITDKETIYYDMYTLFQNTSLRGDVHKANRVSDIWHNMAGTIPDEAQYETVKKTRDGLDQLNQDRIKKGKQPVLISVFSTNGWGPWNKPDILQSKFVNDIYTRNRMAAYQLLAEQQSELFEIGEEDEQIDKQITEIRNKYIESYKKFLDSTNKQTFCHLTKECSLVYDDTKDPRDATLGYNNKQLIFCALKKAVTSNEFIKSQTTAPLIQALQGALQKHSFRGCKSANERTQMVSSRVEYLLTQETAKPLLLDYIKGKNNLKKLHQKISADHDRFLYTCSTPMLLVSNNCWGANGKVGASRGLPNTSNCESPETKSYIASSGSDQAHKSHEAHFKNFKAYLQENYKFAHVQTDTPPPERIFEQVPEKLRDFKITTSSSNMTFKIENTDAGLVTVIDDSRYCVNSHSSAAGNENGASFTASAPELSGEDHNQVLYKSYLAIAAQFCVRHLDLDSQPATLSFNLSALNHETITYGNSRLNVAQLIKETCENIITETYGNDVVIAITTDQCRYPKEHSAQKEEQAPQEKSTFSNDKSLER